MAGHIKYADALNVENQYWQDMRGFKHTTKPFTRIVVGGLKDSRSNPNVPPLPVDLTSLSKGQIVKHLLDVQEAKLAQRLIIKLNNTAYVTAFGNNAVDTCREQIILHQDVFNLSFLYNGNLRSQQPGNCVLARPNGVATTYNSLIDRNSSEGVLLQLQEIVRRKAVDSRRNNMVDEFSHLPVSVGIAMADKLARDQHIDFSLFWLKNNQRHYHMFTGAGRLEAFNRLGARYVQMYLLGTTPLERIAHMKELMIDFYGPLPPIANMNGHVDLHEFIELFKALNHV